MIKITELPEFSGEFPSGNSVPMSSSGATYKIELGTAAKKASSFLLDRTNHTGSQSIGTISDLQTALDSTTKLAIENIFIEDDFMSTSASNGTIGALGWSVVGVSGALAGSELNHPGIFPFSTTSTGALVLTYKTGTAGPDGFNGLTIEGVFRLPSIVNSRYTFGIGYVAAYQSNGYRGITFDPAQSPNWRLHHKTSAGADTFTDTGIAAVANDWVKARLTFASGTTTCKISTTSSPSEVTVTNSGAYTVGIAAHCPQWVWVATSGTKNIDVDAFRMHGISTRL